MQLSEKGGKQGKGKKWVEYRRFSFCFFFGAVVKSESEKVKKVKKWKSEAKRRSSVCSLFGVRIYSTLLYSALFSLSGLKKKKES